MAPAAVQLHAARAIIELYVLSGGFVRKDAPAKAWGKEVE